MMLFTRAGLLALACLAMMVFAGMSVLGVSLGARSLRLAVASPSPAEIAAPSPVETMASRFPSADVTPPSQPATFSTASVIPVEGWEAFDPGPLSGIAAAAPPWPNAAASAPTAIEMVEPRVSEPPVESAAIAEPAKVEPAMTEPAKTEPAKAPAASTPRRVASHSNNVLNDGQIASIKRRLNLTAEQEQMWPAVEAALRKIVYTKTRAAQTSGSAAAYIDPGSAEVQQLKNAALPLLRRLNDEQRREVKMLAYVMGLEAVASQF